jgi:hypothetical protein
MNKISALSALIACGILNLFAANEVITNFKDPSIACDYLIVAPKGFAGPAVGLAQHRNSFRYDDVEHARVAYLDDILIAFPGSDFNHRNVALWKALKWAKENWKMPFRYIVLIGSDYFFVGEDSSVTSIGLMPTWFSAQKQFYTLDSRVCPVPATDDCYLRLSSSDPPQDIRLGDNDTGIYIGRIPAATPGQCSLYVEKVKRFDLSRPRGPWRNNVLAIADDAMMGLSFDTKDHQDFAEIIVDNYLQGYLVTKRYLSAFPMNEFYEKPSAKTAIVHTINQGTSLAFFYGHGNDQVLTNEVVLTSESTDDFTNDSMPFVFLAFTAFNGSVFSYQVPAPMCQKFLFKAQGGVVAYIGSASMTNAPPNLLLGKYIFSELKKDPSASLGAHLARAKQTANANDVYQSAYLNALTYYLLGDPALRMSVAKIAVTAQAVPDSAPTTVHISVPGSTTSQFNYSVTFTVRDSVFPAPGPDFSINMAFSCDSAIAVVSGVVNESVTVPFPQTSQAPFKAIVYVWNDSVDGRAEVLCGAGASNPVARTPSRNAIAGQPMLKYLRGALEISNLKPCRYQVRIFDLRGRSVWNSETLPAAGIASINLMDKKLSHGRYILQLRNQTSDLALPFLHIER